MQNHHSLILSAGAMVMLVFLVGLRMLHDRISEMKSERIHPQSIPTSRKLYAKLSNIKAADNYRNLFEVPVLFYALCAIALANRSVPDWLVYGAWGFVGIRYAHSFVQCTYNKVMHRFPLFLASLALVTGLWGAYLWNL